MSSPPAVIEGTEETKGDDDIEADGKSQENEKHAAYEYSLDPDTRAAEKKLRRVIAKQVGVLLGDVAGHARRALCLVDPHKAFLFWRYP